MQTVTEILIDFSSSMQDKIKLTKQLLLEQVIPTMDYASKISIKTFMSDQKIPKIMELFPLNIADQERLKNVIDNIRSPNGGTPIAAAIRDSLKSLKEFPAADKRIILLTDGEETDGGDYEAEAQKAGEEGIHCEIHIIGIGLKEAQLKKAQSISKYSKGTTSNISYVSGGAYNRTVIETNLTDFSIALSRKHNPTYTAPVLASSALPHTISSQPQSLSTASYTSKVSPAPHRQTDANPMVDNSPLQTQNNITEPSEIGETLSARAHDDINVNAAEPIKPNAVEHKTPASTLLQSNNSVGTIIAKVGDTDADIKGFQEKSVSASDAQEEQVLSLNPFEAVVMSGIFNNVLERMEELSRDFKALKEELKKERNGENIQEGQIMDKKEAAMTLVNSYLSKRYQGRVQSCSEPELGQVFKVLFEDKGPVEYYVVCKNLIDKAFYFTKEEWRVFLNNTKNTQVYVVMPEGNLPEYILIDNLLDWILRGKVVPYLNQERRIEIDTVCLSFG